MTDRFKVTDNDEKFISIKKQLTLEELQSFEKRNKGPLVVKASRTITIDNDTSAIGYPALKINIGEFITIHFPDTDSKNNAHVTITKGDHIDQVDGEPDTNITIAKLKELVIKEDVHFIPYAIKF